MGEEGKRLATWTDPTETDVIHVASASGLPHFEYSQFYPPADCCGDGCELDADAVRILFWPIDHQSATSLNISHTSEATPYTTVLDEFTLYISPDLMCEIHAN